MQFIYLLIRFFFTFILLISVIQPGKAQTVKTEFSGGVNLQTYQVVNDQGGLLRPGQGLTSSYGFAVLIMGNNWIFKTGLYSKRLSNSFYFRLDNNMTTPEQTVSTISTFRIPVVISRKVKLTGRFSISPQFGFSWLSDLDTGQTTIQENQTVFFGPNRSESIEYDLLSRTVSKDKFLAVTGLDLNFQLNWIFTLKAGARYFFGLQTIEETEISYQLNNGELYTGTLVSDGSGWNFHLALVIPIYN